MSEAKWTNEDGDWHLDIGEEYIGLICTHHEYPRIVADGKNLVGASNDDLEANKKWLEKWGRIQMKTDQYRESLYEKEGLC